MTRGIILACSLFMLTSLPAAAFTANGLVGERTGVRWSNAANIGSNQALISTWGAVHGAVATTEWTPGLGDNSASAVMLTHATVSNTSVIVPIKVVGLEYQTDNVASYQDVGGLAECGSHQRTGDIVRLVLDNNDKYKPCFYPGKFTLSSRQTPFRFVRPIISWEKELLEKFSGKPEGVYQGVLPFQIRYAYLSDTGVYTYQNISRSLMVRLTYKKNQVTSVILYGQSLMPMKIDRAKREISGKTIHRVIAKGFDGGMIMRFQDEKHKFHLHHVDSPTYSIPYSIKLICGEGTDCADDGALLVQDGDLKKKFSKKTKSGGVRVVPASGSKWPELKFSLLSSYQEIKIDGPSDTLPEGEYQDHVVLIFEPAL
ncbi:hypothetical protein [Aeromonas simiae]|uniref:hypothetical protein n=1 Tax=Aeromonas simiae TaxID=218936 RepID=UPI0005A7D4C7|nr:hypothetical protein [Aeromonas simiae]